MRSNYFTTVIPSTIAQDMSKRKYVLRKKNMLKNKKNMDTHHIFIVKQVMRSQPIMNVITRKASPP